MTGNGNIENCTKKANRALGFIRRNFGRCPESIKETLYTAMVRPHLEYASGAGNPNLKKDINRLENIQRKASRFLKSCNSRDPGTLTGLLADLGWNSLKQMRTKHDLTLFYQAENGHIEIPLPPYVIPVKRNNKSHHEMATSDVPLQYLARSSLHRLSSLSCHPFLSYGLQVVKSDVHRSSLGQLTCPAQDHFIVSHS